MPKLSLRFDLPRPPQRRRVHPRALLRDGRQLRDVVGLQLESERPAVLGLEGGDGECVVASYDDVSSIFQK